jgi:hypothetical protein
LWKSGDCSLGGSSPRATPEKESRKVRGLVGLYQALQLRKQWGGNQPHGDTLEKAGLIGILMASGDNDRVRGKNASFVQHESTKLQWWDDLKLLTPGQLGVRRWDCCQRPSFEMSKMFGINYWGAFKAHSK